MTANQFRLSDHAVRDLDRIWLDVYDKSFSVAVADRTITAIYEVIKTLADNPEAGHFRENLYPKPVRFLSVYSYLIIYRTGLWIEVARSCPVKWT